MDEEQQPNPESISPLLRSIASSSQQLALSEKQLLDLNQSLKLDQSLLAESNKAISESRVLLQTAADGNQLPVTRRRNKRKAK